MDVDLGESRVNRLMEDLRPWDLREVEEARLLPVKPIFIFGVPRSGTTLLVNLIGLHPHLAPIFETRFLRNLMRHCEDTSRHWNGALNQWPWSLGAGGWLRSRFAARCESFRAKVVTFHSWDIDHSGFRRNEVPIDRQLILYTLDELAQETDRFISSLSARPKSEVDIYSRARELVGSLFALHAARMDKPFWVNKTPGLLTYLPYLAKLFPDAKCLHIVRDGRDVAVSMLNVAWGSKTVVESARRWKKLLLAGRKDIALRPLDCLEVRYEKLIESPREVLGEIFGFLELEANLNDILAQVNVYRDSGGRWRTALGGEERTAFAREAGGLLIELGYEKDDSWIER